MPTEPQVTDEAVEALAEFNAIRELWGYWADAPTREAKEGRQRQRYAQLSEDIKDLWREGAREQLALVASFIRNQERQRIREALEDAFDETPSVRLAVLADDEDLKGRVYKLDPVAFLAAALDSLEDSKEVAGDEVLVAVEGVVSFMRSADGDDRCLCCDGPHVFARGIDVEPEPSRFAGLMKSHVSSWISEALFENHLEGRRVRVSLHLLPDSNPSEQAEEKGGEVGG